MKKPEYLPPSYFYKSAGIKKQTFYDYVKRYQIQSIGNSPKLYSVKDWEKYTKYRIPSEFLSTKTDTKRSA
jgi:hypothetical protein